MWLYCTLCAFIWYDHEARTYVEHAILCAIIFLCICICGLSAMGPKTVKIARSCVAGWRPTSYIIICRLIYIFGNIFPSLYVCVAGYRAQVCNTYVGFRAISAYLHRLICIFIVHMFFFMKPYDINVIEVISVNSHILLIKLWLFESKSLRYRVIKFLWFSVTFLSFTYTCWAL